MTTINRQKQTRTPRQDLYQEITNKIIAHMEQGKFPWVQPWDSNHAACAVGLPVNATTQRRYSGINVLILWGAVFDHGFTSQNWLTFKQAKSLGGSVRKGEKGQVVCYADRFTPQKEREQARSEGRDPQTIPFLKRYRVFNIEQCENLCEDLPTGTIGKSQPSAEREIIPRAERLAKDSGADIRHGGDRAFYEPLRDFVQLPPQPAFFEQIDYYRTFFHELGHWTGHAKRLDRDQSGRFKTKSYAREELIAEMTAAFTCAALSIAPTVRHADYLASWLKILKEDKRAIFRAASQASKAAEFLLAFDSQEKEQEAAA
ncbi:MAG: DUF1738 domain-containing protein [Planctomycetaceae bacterium]|nr:DUF1738 domain-containing protein [Planctomycetaceae bacterium]